MDMYQKYTSPFGYQTGTGGIDTYGVNHNEFSLRDEIEYQFARQKRENELQAQYNALKVLPKIIRNIQPIFGVILTITTASV